MRRRKKKREEKMTRGERIEQGSGRGRGEMERQGVETKNETNKRRKGVEMEGMGVFLVMTKNAFVPVKCDNSVNTYSRISTVP